MDIGAAIFFTEYSIGPAGLAVALEERGFESLWGAVHSHIPVTLGHAPDGLDELKRLRDRGCARASLRLPAEPTDKLLPILDRWATLIRWPR